MTAAADSTFIPTNGDPHSPMLEVQNTPQRVDSTLSAQHSGTGLLCRHDVLMLGFDETIGEIPTTTVPSTFEAPMPSRPYSGMSSICAGEAYHPQPSRPPLAHTTSVPGRVNFTHHNFKTTVSPALYGCGGRRR